MHKFYLQVMRDVIMEFWKLVSGGRTSGLALRGMAIYE